MILTTLLHQEKGSGDEVKQQREGTKWGEYMSLEFQIEILCKIDILFREFMPLAMLNSQKTLFNLQPLP